MPTAQKIRAYWETKYDIGERECFACGAPWHLERCHIHSLSFEGNNSIRNLHLLCRGCHQESEGLKTYWTWFEKKRKSEWKPPMEHIFKMLRLNGINVPRISKKLGPLWEHLSPSQYEEKMDRLVHQMMEYVRRLA